MKKRILKALTTLDLRRRAENAASTLPALMAEAERAVTTLYSGEHRQRRAGPGEKFWQFREYAPGDRPQDIDWRQSAKGDRVFIRQKEWQTAQSILFWVQNDKGMALQTHKSLASKFETGVILSLALGILLTRSGERIGEISEPLRVGRSESALLKLGENLTRTVTPIPAGPALPLAGLLPKGSGLVLAGDFFHPPESLDITLGILSERCPQGVLIQTLDPAEITLPYNGRAIFRTMYNDNDFPIANVQSIRNAYSDRLQQHIHTVKMIARNHGYHHILHDTAETPAKTLTSLWRMMGGMT